MHSARMCCAYTTQDRLTDSLDRKESEVLRLKSLSKKQGIWSAVAGNKQLTFEEIMEMTGGSEEQESLLLVSADGATAAGECGGRRSCW